MLLIFCSIFTSAKKNSAKIFERKIQNRGFSFCHYIVCENARQARKDKADREAIIASLEEQLKKGAKSLVGNKGYRKYLKIAKGSASVDMEKVEYESRFDGKWVLVTNTELSASHRK
jgi:hypothetical protein